MKTVEVKGQNVVILKARGLGDGGVAVRYFVEEADGTFSEVGEWYSDPAVAEKVYASPDATHLDWVVAEARRQTIQMDVRPPQVKRPIPEATKAADVKSVR